jgi:signal recognition particle subunit SEC65
MGTEETLDDVLEHYGIKGMKWGVRRTEEQLARARGKRFGRKSKEPPPQSEDAKRARASAEKVKKEGVSSLSNQELQQLNKRLNLEKNYSDLVNPKKGEGKKKGITPEDKKLIAAIIQVAGKAAFSTAKQNPAAKAVGSAIELYDK